jgi:hypothetical protein
MGSVEIVVGEFAGRVLFKQRIEQVSRGGGGVRSHCVAYPILKLPTSDMTKLIHTQAQMRFSVRVSIR